MLLFGLSAIVYSVVMIGYTNILLKQLSSKREHVLDEHICSTESVNLAWHRNQPALIINGLRYKDQVYCRQIVLTPLACTAESIEVTHGLSQYFSMRDKHILSSCSISTAGFSIESDFIKANGRWANDKLVVQYNRQGKEGQVIYANKTLYVFDKDLQIRFKGEQGSCWLNMTNVPLRVKTTGQLQILYDRGLVNIASTDLKVAGKRLSLEGQFDRNSKIGEIKLNDHKIEIDHANVVIAGPLVNSELIMHNKGCFVKSFDSAWLSLAGLAAPGHIELQGQFRQWERFYDFGARGTIKDLLINIESCSQEEENIVSDRLTEFGERLLDRITAPIKRSRVRAPVAKCTKCSTNRSSRPIDSTRAQQDSDRPQAKSCQCRGLAIDGKAKPNAGSAIKAQEQKNPISTAQSSSLPLVKNTHESTVHLQSARGIIRAKKVKDDYVIDCSGLGFELPAHLGQKEIGEICIGFLNLPTQSGVLKYEGPTGRNIKIKFGITTDDLKAKAEIFTKDVQGKLDLIYDLSRLKVRGMLAKADGTPWLITKGKNSIETDIDIRIGNLIIFEKRLTDARVLFKPGSLYVTSVLPGVKSGSVQVWFEDDRLLIASDQVHSLGLIFGADLPVSDAPVFITGYLQDGELVGKAIVTDFATTKGTGPLTLIRILSPGAYINSLLQLNPINLFKSILHIGANKWPSLETQWRFKPGHFLKIKNMIANNKQYSFSAKGMVDFDIRELAFVGRIAQRGLVQRITRSEKPTGGIIFELSGPLGNPQMVIKNKKGILSFFVP